MANTIDEGYIKFRYDWIPASLPEIDLSELIFWRQKLYAAKLIGSYANGVGFGNISQRYRDNQFIISASGSGNFSSVDASHFSLVDDFDLERNWLSCCGNAPASSESLSHAAIYASIPSVNSVIHIHDAGFWKINLNKLPTSERSALFGTSAIAIAIQKIVKKENQTSGLVIMGGHEEGVIFYGKNFDLVRNYGITL